MRAVETMFHDLARSGRAIEKERRRNQSLRSRADYTLSFKDRNMRAIETILRELIKSERDLAKAVKKNQLLSVEYDRACLIPSDDDDRMVRPANSSPYLFLKENCDEL